MREIRTVLKKRIQWIRFFSYLLEFYKECFCFDIISRWFPDRYRKNISLIWFYSPKELAITNKIIERFIRIS
jgi:hypothetical protein